MKKKNNQSQKAYAKTSFLKKIVSASTSSVAVFNVYIKDEKFDYRLNISMFVYQNLANPKNYNT